MTRRSRGVAAVAGLLTAAGIGLLGLVAYEKVDTHIYQERARAQLVVEARAPKPAPGTVPLQEGDLLGEIVSERIGLRAAISEGESDGVLRRAVGHVPDTAAPGQIGNVALAGHRDGFFRPLRDIRVGDVITVTAGGVDVRYEVEWTRVVAPADVWVIGPSSARVLTLITCYPFTFIGDAPSRFIVRAQLQS
jgi:sortase A